MKRISVKYLWILLAILAILLSVCFFIFTREPVIEPVQVDIVSEKTLIPGGHSVGIKMDVKGVLVVGLEEIETADSIVNPGFDAGLQIGDIILSINDIEVSYAYEVTNIVKNSDGVLKMKVLRGDNVLFYTINAAKDISTGEYKLGIWVKEKIAGIGTLTFYDPETNTFAALGHGIYERKTSMLVEAGGGELLKTEVNSIKEGESGTPGEIRGIFYDQNIPLGNVFKNSKHGIFASGINIEEINLAEPMVIGTKDQIKTGKAYILTTIEGTEVEKFEIKITKINKHNDQGNKGIELKVTDENLLSNSGGIIQGMSGSPIIQDGKLVGAVTHVLVNDPTRGYGIFIENMLEAAK